RPRAEGNGGEQSERGCCTTPSPGKVRRRSCHRSRYQTQWEEGSGVELTLRSSMPDNGQSVKCPRHKRQRFPPLDAAVASSCKLPGNLPLLAPQLALDLSLLACSPQRCWPLIPEDNVCFSYRSGRLHASRT